MQHERAGEDVCPALLFPGGRGSGVEGYPSEVVIPNALEVRGAEPSHTSILRAPLTDLKVRPPCTIAGGTSRPLPSVVIKPGMHIGFGSHEGTYEVAEVGYLQLAQRPTDQLTAGEVGHVMGAELCDLLAAVV